MRPAVAASVLAALAACHSDSVPPPGPAPAPAPTAPATLALARSGITPAWLDRTADPCTDFYQYACGGFIATAQIPADRDNWGTNEIIIKDTEDYLHGVLEAAAHMGSARDPTTEQLGAYYAACMDTAAIAQAGTQPIAPLLAKIAAVTDASTAAQAVIAMHVEGLSPLFGLGPRQDFADATQVIAGIDQAGLGLPERKYYLEDSGTLAKTREVCRCRSSASRRTPR